MSALNLQNVQFVKSAAGPSDFISDGLPQFVFAGKSNVGKSSVINRLLNRRNFARVGDTPGKTAHVNYFRIDGRVYFVDLPGYGYAKVPVSEKRRWAELMEAFFSDPSRLSLGVLIVDARHAPTKDDIIMSDFFRLSGHPMVVVANKTDKLSKTQAEACPGIIAQELGLTADIPVLPFSAEKGTNRDRLISMIENPVR